MFPPSLPPVRIAAAGVEAAARELHLAAGASSGIVTPFIGMQATVHSLCKQLISHDLNSVVTELLLRVKMFQDRAMAKNAIKVWICLPHPPLSPPLLVPMDLPWICLGSAMDLPWICFPHPPLPPPCLSPQAASRRWYVCGLREVRKAVKLKRALSVVVAPNIEQMDAVGGLDDHLQDILDKCAEQGVTVVFALTRKRLGQVYGCRKRVSAVAVLDAQGVEELHVRMVALTGEGQAEWEERVKEGGGVPPVILLEEREEEEGEPGPWGGRGGGSSDVEC